MIFLNVTSINKHAYDASDKLINIILVLLNEEPVAGARQTARIGESFIATDDYHLRKWAILGDHPCQSTNVCLCQYDRTLQIEGTLYTAVRDGLTLGDGLLRILEHVKEEVLIWEVLLSRHSNVVHCQ